MGEEAVEDEEQDEEEDEKEKDGERDGLQTKHRLLPERRSRRLKSEVRCLVRQGDWDTLQKCFIFESSF